MSFLVYKSSAGSGKTFTLVKEYLSLVLLHPEKYKNILAVTFTNKAANEMKERVIETLSKLLDRQSVYDGTTLAMIEEISKVTRLTENEITKRARIALDNILHNYNDFAISTIDSFIHRIVRSFSIDLKLPYNFEVDLDTDDMISNVTQLLISHIGHNKEVTRALLRFSESKSDDEKSWNIEKDIADFCRMLLKEESMEAMKQIRSLETTQILEMEQSLIRFMKNFENNLQSLGQQSISLIENNDLNLADFSYGKNGITGFFNKLAKGNFTDPLPGKNVEKTLEKEDWSAGKSDKYTRDRISSIRRELLEIYNRIEKKLEDYPKYILYKLIRKTIFPIAILKEIEASMEEYGEADSLIHISEFGKRIASIINNEPVPFIYERIGEKYQHYLIDEFQDTSIMQWHNLLPLFENSLAKGNSNMVVGDSKQSIYRWRGGELEQLDYLPKILNPENSEIIKDREIVLTQNFKMEPLKTNFRSKTNIVEFNNDFFKEAVKLLPDHLKSIYSDLEQGSIEKNKGGYVEINILENTEYRKELFYEIERQINECLDDGFELKDIAILCRKNDDASEIARFLLSEEIKVVSSESLLLSKSPEVNLLIAIIKLILNPDDILSKSLLAKYNFDISQGDNSLHEYISYFVHGNEPSENLQISIDQSLIFENTEIWKNMALYDMIEDIIRKTGINKNFNPYLCFLSDKILEAFGKRKYNLNDFLSWWELKKNKFSIILPEDLNAVSILTIHKSKGLEFPVVIFPFADLNTIRMGVKERWVDPELEEFKELKRSLIALNKDVAQTKFNEIYLQEKNKTFIDMINLLYVAFTRAMDRLYILQKRKGDQKAIENANNLMQEFLKGKGMALEKSAFSFGEKQKVNHTKPQENNILELRSYISIDWKNRIILSHGSKANNFEEALERKEWGNIFHELLSKIKEEKDFDLIIQDVECDILFSRKIKDEIIAKLSSLKDDVTFMSFLDGSWKTLNERDIILSDSQVVRPDKILIKEGNVKIIDYKTGGEDESHKRQIKKYAKALESMGYIVESGFLVYINDEIKIVQI